MPIQVSGWDYMVSCGMESFKNTQHVKEVAMSWNCLVKRSTRTLKNIPLAKLNCGPQWQGLGQTNHLCPLRMAMAVEQQTSMLITQHAILNILGLSQGYMTAMHESL